jgi:hypothetical protein
MGSHMEGRTQTEVLENRGRGEYLELRGRK